MKKKAVVIGLGISGRSSAELLLQNKKSVIALDKKAESLKNDPALQKLMSQGMELFSDDAPIDLLAVDQIIISPGVPPTHPLVKSAAEKKIEVLGEIELAFRYLKNLTIGVTGTNGKTTVVMLIKHILLAAGKKAQSLGNIGSSLSSYALHPDPEEILVVELSSFQLETLHQKCLDVAVIINITPDHLDRYDSMEEYAKAKCQIENCLKKGKNLWVSKLTMQEYGHLLKHPKNFEDIPSVVAPISSMRYIQLGVPERQNIQAAYPLCRQFGITDAEFESGLKTFRKPKHRIEFVGEWNQIAFYNDSKATNIDSVQHAVGLFNGPIILLAGGVHKGASYRPWIDAFRGKVTRIVAFGAAAPLMEEDLKNDFPVDRVETLEEAVLCAVKNAKAPTTILLSPGCSSFDQFRNYEHRGNEFKRIFEEKVWIERKRS